jgi:methionyl-tRNA formyltransferase
MRIACVGYRDWALNIYDFLARSTNHQFLILRSRDQYDEYAIKDFKPDLVLFYGWSWIISSSLVNKFSCIMLHPSPLPKYRGGSPIQNQILRGENVSAVSIFLMDEGVDTGPILSQKPLSLDGGISEIFTRITKIGSEITLQLLEHGLQPVSQNNEDATIYSRIKPKDNEITTNELRTMPVKYLYNKIRMLQAPYPGAFIRTVDGYRLVITEAYIDECFNDYE